MPHKSSIDLPRFHNTNSATMLSSAIALPASDPVSEAPDPSSTRGRYLSPAVAPQVSAHTRTIAIVMLQKIARSVDQALAPECARSIRHAYPIQDTARPNLQKRYSKEVLWTPAPRRPVGANAPG